MLKASISSLVFIAFGSTPVCAQHFNFNPNFLEDSENDEQSYEELSARLFEITMMCVRDDNRTRSELYEDCIAAESMMETHDPETAGGVSSDQLKFEYYFQHVSIMRALAFATPSNYKVEGYSRSCQYTERAWRDFDLMNDFIDADDFDEAEKAEIREVFDVVLKDVKHCRRWYDSGGETPLTILPWR